jgi:hypothetical protein
MTRRLLLVWLFLIAVVSISSATDYLTGRLVRVESGPATQPGAYTLYIAHETGTYAARLIEKPADQLDWAVNDRVEFYLSENTIYLKRPNGQVIKLSLLMSAADLPFPPVPRQPVPVNRAASPEALTPEVPRCAEIAAMGAQFALLAKACEFALSPQNLPNFICKEQMERAKRKLSDDEWHNSDVFSAEVTFLDGHGDWYSNFAIDGHPLDLPSYNGGFPFSQFLREHESDSPSLGELLRKHRGYWPLTEFGTGLVTIFDPRNQTSFAYNSAGSPPSGPTVMFDFHINSPNFGLVLHARKDSKVVSSNPAWEGMLWIDRVTGELVRVEMTASGIDASFPRIFSASTTNYGDISISELGTFLLPTASEAVTCNRLENKCFKNVISFHDCKRFAAKSRIVIPSQ